MACFIVPATEAIVTTIVSKKMKKNPSSTAVSNISEKMGWLNKMLWGGSALLAFEHIWHGEVTPWAPFLTNAASPEQTMEMFKEMGTSGVAMALLVTGVWGVMVAVSSKITAKTQDTQSEGAAS